MMLDINIAEIKQGFLKYLPVGALIGLVLFAELILAVTVSGDAAAAQAAPATIGNTRALGQLIYTHYIYLFQAAGMVLLVAMVGAIVLTLRTRPGVRRQSIARQIARRKEEAIEVVKVPTGEGV
jgi:NADH-quinone oxidoreductase subunit J